MNMYDLALWNCEIKNNVIYDVAELDVLVFTYSIEGYGFSINLINYTNI